MFIRVFHIHDETYTNVTKRKIVSERERVPLVNCSFEPNLTDQFVNLLSLFPMGIHINEKG